MPALSFPGRLACEGGREGRSWARDQREPDVLALIIGFTFRWPWAVGQRKNYEEEANASVRASGRFAASCGCGDCPSVADAISRSADAVLYDDLQAGCDKQRDDHAAGCRCGLRCRTLPRAADALARSCRHVICVEQAGIHAGCVVEPDSNRRMVSDGCLGICCSLLIGYGAHKGQAVLRFVSALDCVLSHCLL